MGRTLPHPPTTLVTRLANLPHAVLLLLLAVSFAAKLAPIYLAPNGATNVDLHVYVHGGATLRDPYNLYGYLFPDQAPNAIFPFTYPPFAAVVFYPLHLLPFGLVALAWQIGTVAALYGGVRISLRLVAAPTATAHRLALLWTAIGLWVEPVYNTLGVGQISVFLMLAVLWSVYTARWWLSGLLVGLAAGIKLTPAITGLYFVGVRRWGAAVFSAVVFFGTIVLSGLAVGPAAYLYFTDLGRHIDRVWPVGSAFNQSWRGGISRIVGHDAGYGLLVPFAVAVTAILVVLAWRALNTDQAEPDRLGKLLVVEFFGLLMAPIAWTHHWVWLVPLLIWLVHGPMCQRLGAQILCWSWLALTLPDFPGVLSAAQPDFWQSSRPWYQAWAGLFYIAPTMVTLIWIAAAGRRTAGSDHPPTAEGGRHPGSSEG